MPASLVHSRTAAPGAVEFFKDGIGLRYLPGDRGQHVMWIDVNASDRDLRQRFAGPVADAAMAVWDADGNGSDRPADRWLVVEMKSGFSRSDRAAHAINQIANVAGLIADQWQGELRLAGLVVGPDSPPVDDAALKMDIYNQYGVPLEFARCDFGQGIDASPHLARCVPADVEALRTRVRRPSSAHD